MAGRRSAPPTASACETGAAWARRRRTRARSQDDDLSHLLFFAGFAGIDAVLLWAEAAAVGFRAELSRRDYASIGANAAFVAAAIVANLGFEEIGLDLVVVALVAALALGLWRRRGPRPLTVYLGISYVAGLGLTIVAKLL